MILLKYWKKKNNKHNKNIFWIHRQNENEVKKKRSFIAKRSVLKDLLKNFPWQEKKNTDENLDLQIGVRAQEIENTWVDKRYFYIANLFKR